MNGSQNLQCERFEWTGFFFFRRRLVSLCLEFQFDTAINFDAAQIDSVDKFISVSITLKDVRNCYFFTASAFKIRVRIRFVVLCKEMLATQKGVALNINIVIVLIFTAG